MNWEKVAKRITSLVQKGRYLTEQEQACLLYTSGIALVDDSGDRPRLRYVFDISDTGTREHSRTPWLWQLEERHLDSVQAMLERIYDAVSYTHLDVYKRQAAI